MHALTREDEIGQDLRRQEEQVEALAAPYLTHPLLRTKSAADRTILAVLFALTLRDLRHATEQWPLDFRRDLDRVRETLLGALAAAWDYLVAPKLCLVAPMLHPVSLDFRASPLVATAVEHLQGIKLAARLKLALTRSDRSTIPIYLLGQGLATSLNEAHVMDLWERATHVPFGGEPQGLAEVLAGTHGVSWTIMHPLWVQLLGGTTDSARSVGYAKFPEGRYPLPTGSILYADFLPTSGVLCGRSGTPMAPGLGWHPYLPFVMYADCVVRSREVLKIYDGSALLRLDLSGSAHVARP